MIAEWMLYATALGVLLGGAAFALERLAAMRHMAIRWLWLGAIAGTLLGPVLVALLPRSATPAPTAMAVANPTSNGAQGSELPVRREVTSWRRLNPSLLNRPLLILWAAGSLLLAGILLGTRLIQRRASRSWPAQDLDGTPVLVAGDAGPLVFGLLRLQIVLPQWALLRSEAEWRLMLAHEEEHRQARDPNLLLLSVIALVLNPWNLALWWQLRRLRLAIETDCDRRVLGAGVDLRSYGTLLLDVGSRPTWQPALTGAAFSEMPSLLERRIDAMTAPAPRHPVARALAFGTLAAGVLALACATPRPAPISPSPASERLFPALAIPQPQPTGTQPYTREQMSAAIARYFPAVLRGDTTHLPIRFVLAADGRVVATSQGPETRPSFRFERLEYGRLETTDPGYYGPAGVRLEVYWLKPDSIGDAVPGLGFTTVTIGRPSDNAGSGLSFEEQARTWLRGRPELLRGVGATDTAYVWFVLDAAHQVVRAGRARSEATMSQEARIEQPGWLGHKDRFRPGLLADGMVVVVAWSPL